MSQMSSLIGFWNSKTVESEQKIPSKPRKENIKVKKWGNDCEKNDSIQVKHKLNRSVKDLTPVVVEKRKNEPGKKNTGSKSDDSDKMNLENSRLCQTTKRPEESAPLNVKYGNNVLKSANCSNSARPNSHSYPLSTPSSSCPSSPTPKIIISKDKPISPFAKFRQMETEQATHNLKSSSMSTLSVRSPGSSTMTNLFRNSSLPPSPRPTVTHGQMSVPGTGALRSSSGAKDIILGWVQQTLRDYPLPLTNFSSHWANGLAFCALIHVFYPDSFDWNSLKAENRKYNFTLGFDLSEELAGIYPLLEVEDMLHYKKPDWKCVFTYVQSFYRRFRNYQTSTKKHENPIPFRSVLKAEENIPNPTTVTATPEEELVTPQQTPEGNPTNTSSKTRSKSLMFDSTSAPTMTVTDRKYSFNHSLPAEQTQGVDFNTRQ